MKAIEQFDDYQDQISLKNDYKEKCERWTDFINTIKDTLPFSNKLEGETIDIFYKTMDLMIDNSLKPSIQKRIQYKDSKFNIEMNKLPTFANLYESIQMVKDCYEKLAKKDKRTLLDLFISMI